MVVDQRSHSGRLYSEIKRLNPDAPVQEVVGRWPHTAELRWDSGLPDALSALGLLPVKRPRAGDCAGWLRPPRAPLSGRGLGATCPLHAELDSREVPK